MIPITLTSLLLVAGVTTASPRPYSSSNRDTNVFVSHQNDPIRTASILAASVNNNGPKKANTFALQGLTGASAQQLFLGTTGKVLIVDKVENNTAQVNGHAAWATEYDLKTNTYRSMDIVTNSFCAGGNQLGNGSWVNIGGNQAVVGNGVASKDGNAQEGQGIYQDRSGGRDVRMFTPCDDATCNWADDINGMPGNRWYPTVETLQDGSVIIIGGNLNGSFVNNVGSNVNTYEYWPSRGPPIDSPFLNNTAPANLYPLTWILPDSRLFMQASWSTTILNLTDGVETKLPDIIKAQKTYPASGATAMLPLLVSNNWEEKILFCGGMDPVRDDWNPDLWNIANTSTSSSCVSIKPMDAAPTWSEDDNLPENRGMGNFIILPDYRLFLVNGVAKGSAGYGNQSWVLGHSYAQDPVFRPAYYNPAAKSGSRWQYLNLPSSTIGRLYHSTATLLPDGSVFIAGSNPNADVVTNDNYPAYPYKTEYQSEIFYPDYYDQPRPNPIGIPTTINYGGTGFNLNLGSDSINSTTNLNTIKVGLMRTGFSTHSMNFGMKYIQLNSTYTVSNSSSVTLHVSQLPPNPSLFVPGPALLFVTVNDIPSIGQFVMVGSGQIGTQSVAPSIQLVSSSGSSLLAGNNSTSTGSGTGTSSSGSGSGSTSGSNGSSGSSNDSKKAGVSKLNSNLMTTFGLMLAFGIVLV